MPDVNQRPVNRIQKLATVALEKLDPFAFGNPRSMQPRMKEVLNTSLREFGIVEPIVVRKAKSGHGRYEILNGHHRLAELKALGETNTQVVIVDLEDDVKARAVALALNRIGADWDYAQLTKYIDELIEAGGSLATPQWLVNTTGFTATEVEQLAQAGTEFLNDVAAQNERRVEDGGDGSSPDDAGSVVERVNFTVPLTEAQQEAVQTAIRAAKRVGGRMTNSEALTIICKAYVEDTDESA